jgi:hypothetical protein
MKNKNRRRHRRRGGFGPKPGEFGPGNQKNTPREFYRHLSIYLIFAAFFFLINLFTAPGSWWFFWPVLGWGIGVAFHFVGTFLFPTDEEEEEYSRMPLEDQEEYEDELELKEPQKRWNEKDLV